MDERRGARPVDVVVIGAGQAGLAMSHVLSARGVEHVVLERGTAAHSWRTERWDSLRLLTPNWLSRLPGWTYRGADPDGYMTAPEVAAHLESYRRSFGAPVHTGVTVRRVARTADGFLVVADAGTWTARAVVLATGACSTPRRPALADGLPDGIQQLDPITYRNPTTVTPGRVLVVGASASGLQLADELRRAGRDVTVAVGEHVRVPRTYRGMDLHWWMDATGLLDQRVDGVADPARARRVQSFQLVGSPERRDLDLHRLAADGVQLVGRVAGRSGSALQCSGALANVVALADLKLRRLLDAFDAHATAHGLDPELGEPTRPDRVRLPAGPLEVDLRTVAAVVWATGFRPHHPWLAPELAAAVQDRSGSLVHDGGVLPVPGLYALGLPFQRRRKSNFLDGVGPDAVEVSAHLIGHLDLAARGCVGR